MKYRKLLPLFLISFVTSCNSTSITDITTSTSSSNTSTSSEVIREEVTTYIKETENKESYVEKDYSFNYFEDYSLFNDNNYEDELNEIELVNYSSFSGGEITSSGNYLLEGECSSIKLKLNEEGIVHLFLKIQNSTVLVF